MPKIGCEKCEYTGFAFGKIPCECQENSAVIPEQGNAVSGCVGSIPHDYGMNGTYFYGGSNNRPMVHVGEWVSLNEIIIGVVIEKPDENGMVLVQLRDGAIFRLLANDLEKCFPNRKEVIQ